MEFQRWPVRLSVMSFNVWGNDRWPERREALQETLRRHRPDVIGLQEVTPDILEAIVETLPSTHKYVMDDSNKGWSVESNIIWNDDLLQKEEHKYIDLGFEDNPLRGLFMAQFNVRANPSIKFIFSTTHLPWPGSPTEIRTGLNQRVVLAHKIATLTKSGLFESKTDQELPVILTGDFNESFHPQRILRQLADFKDVFAEVGVPAPVTHPVRSSTERECSMPPQALDWIMIRASGDELRVITASSVNMKGPLLPSDHLPVISVLEVSEL